MRFTILAPHYSTGQMTAYAVSQLLKYKGKHDLDIVVIDNNPGDASIAHLYPLLEHITIIDYPKERLQSQGIAFDYVLPLIKTEYFITIESDSFPEKEGWLDYYEDLADAGYDAAGSLLKLSGGTYLHPCGAMYKTEVWREAMVFAQKIPYHYFPNMAMKESFACHLMVHVSIFKDFISAPHDYVELSKDYIPFSENKAIEKLNYYSFVCGVFHNGMGNSQESVKTYGQRTIESEAPTMYFDNKQKLIKRIGAEPGQFFSWWMAAFQKQMFAIPTETKWINDKEGQQQEYTLMENGFKHLWSGTAYLSMKGTASNDVYEFKKNQIESILKSK